MRQVDARRLGYRDLLDVPFAVLALLPAHPEQEFALDKTKKDEAYYRVLRVMQERGVSDVEDM